MYRQNTLQRNVLITTDEVIFHAPTNHTLDPRTTENSIIIAEERFIRPLLGYDYYQALIAQKNLLITDGNKDAQQTLINNSLPAGSQEITLTAGMVINALEYLDTDNKKLWTEHLWKLTAECVILTAYPEGYVHIGSEGVHQKNPPAGPMTSGGVVSPDLRTMKWALDKKLMDRIDPLIESLHQWVCKQKKADSAKYPDYEKDCDCDSKGIAFKRKSQFILGLYDEEDEE